MGTYSLPSSDTDEELASTLPAVRFKVPRQAQAPHAPLVSSLKPTSSMLSKIPKLDLNGNSIKSGVNGLSYKQENDVPDPNYEFLDVSNSNDYDRMETGIGARPGIGLFSLPSARNVKFLSFNEESILKHIKRRNINHLKKKQDSFRISEEGDQEENSDVSVVDMDSNNNTSGHNNLSRSLEVSFGRSLSQQNGVIRNRSHKKRGLSILDMMQFEVDAAEEVDKVSEEIKDMMLKQFSGNTEGDLEHDQDIEADENKSKFRDNVSILSDEEGDGEIDAPQANNLTEFDDLQLNIGELQEEETRFLLSLELEGGSGEPPDIFQQK